MILFTGGAVYPSMHWGRHPPGRHPPRQTPPWADSFPWASTPRHGQTPPDGDCSGRYANYWNAFLFRNYSAFRRRCFIKLQLKQINIQIPFTVGTDPIFTYISFNSFRLQSWSGNHLCVCLRPGIRNLCKSPPILFPYGVLYYRVNKPL